MDPCSKKGQLGLDMAPHPIETKLSKSKIQKDNMNIDVLMCLVIDVTKSVTIVMDFVASELRW